VTPIQKARKLTKARQIEDRCQSIDVSPPAWVRHVIRQARREQATQFAILHAGRGAA